MNFLKRNSAIIAIVLLAVIGCFLPEQAFSETCLCDPPCSGSRTCPDGCWAFCEERASGPYCAKGCVYDTAAMTSNDTLSPQGKLNTVDMKLPQEQIKPLLERLFGVTLVLSPAESKKERLLVSMPAASKADHVVVKLKNIDLKGILDELKNQGIALRVK